ncbi:MAG: cysteine desulfurase [Verrucomicrobia subdivision 3 bacterium]|nr:cysteine desulfurase [Limisphaerales bacterium]
MPNVYLDHQASTSVLPEVLAAMQPWFSESFGSPSSIHQHGLRARDALQHAREQVAAFINAESPEDIIFTSGATEAANLAVKGAAFANQRQGKHIVLSAIEHPAIANSVEFLHTLGFSSSVVKVDSHGFLDPDDLRAGIREDTSLICIHHANHDIGTIQAVGEIAAIAAERGIPLFVDASASGGWLPIDVQKMGAGLLSLAPHRFYGPKGVGVLYRHRRARITPLIHGGVQEGGRRAGTENVPGIVGAGIAAEIAARDLRARREHVSGLQRQLWEKLRSSISHFCLNGPAVGERRLPTNLNISIEFVEGEGVALMADVQGIAIASGAACVSKALKASPVLTAIGLDHALAQGNIIISFGKDNTEAEIDHVARTLPKIVEKLRAMSPMWDDFQKGLIRAQTQ